MNRYTATMLGPDIRNLYGSVQYPNVLEQAWYLFDIGHPLLAQWLLDGLITVKKSARLLDDLELRKVLRRTCTVAGVCPTPSACHEFACMGHCGKRGRE